MGLPSTSMYVAFFSPVWKCSSEPTGGRLDSRFIARCSIAVTMRSASSTRPCEISQRGDSGKRKRSKMPTSARSAPIPGGHLVDIGGNQGQVGSHADSGDDAGNDEVGVVTDKGGVEGTQSGDNQRDQQDIPPPEAVGQRAEDKRPDDVPDEVQQHR